MRAGLLIMLLIGVGCAGSEVPRTSGGMESRRDTCPSRQLSPERERAVAERCSSRQVWWSSVGEALSGAATAVRMPPKP
jgi:hypothetical protein